jgi:hypothetical protein
MASNDAGTHSGKHDSMHLSAAEIAELREAVKACYCGLGPACTHWDEMTPEGRKDCSRDKRAAADAFWKNGTIS